MTSVEIHTYGRQIDKATVLGVDNPTLEVLGGILRMNTEVAYQLALLNERATAGHSKENA